MKDLYRRSLPDSFFLCARPVSPAESFIVPPTTAFRPAPYEPSKEEFATFFSMFLGVLSSLFFRVLLVFAAVTSFEKNSLVWFSSRNFSYAGLHPRCRLSPSFSSSFYLGDLYLRSPIDTGDRDLVSPSIRFLCVLKTRRSFLPLIFYPSFSLLRLACSWIGGSLHFFSRKPEPLC